jgi:hypothetical protein
LIVGRIHNDGEILMMKQERLWWRCVRIGSIALACFVVALSGAARADVKLVEDDKGSLDFKLELQAGFFDGSNAWFGEGESFVGGDVDHWVESAVEFGLGGEIQAGRSVLFGELTALYSRTYEDDATGFTIGLDDDPSTLKLEQAHIGWRSGKLFDSLDENALTIKAGNFDYTIGTGLLIADGGGDGGVRGGWWIGGRKAFKQAGLVSFDSGPWLAEAFYLKNRPRNLSGEGEAWGTNLEYEFSSRNLLVGGSWFRVSDAEGDDLEDFDVASVRGKWSPLRGLSFDFEFVDQGKNGTDGQGWYLNSGYQWEDAYWKPTLSYRYSHFSGDDPSTTEDERFRPVAYGFTDYGTWYQGEIAGNYPLENSNLNTHMLRLQLAPHEDLTLNVMYYNFTLDEEQIFGDPVTDDDFGDELNLAADWAVNDSLFVIATVGVLFPGDGATSWTGGDKDWVYTMLYASYTF